jgi:hypothetical protein
MSLDIKSSLDAVKRQALLVIMKSVKVPYINLSNDLFSYVSTDNTAFTTLLARLNFNAALFSSTQVSAMWLLAYLDFYALYTIMVSNYTVFSQLKTVSEGKYRYIYNLYKELERVIGTKKILQDYSYGFYNNFLYPKDINAVSSRTVTRSGKLTNILETYPVVTLPSRSTKEVLPTALTFFTDDQSISDIDSTSDTNFLKYSILRYQNNKVSIVRSIEPAKDGISYSRGTPDVTGTIAGYFTDTIYIKVTESTHNNDGSALMKVQGSTNNADWSSDLTVLDGIPKALTIEGDIEVGLNITLYDGSSLAIGDRWILNISHMNIKPPTIDLVIRFGMLEPISFITYMDTSIHKLDILSSAVRRRKFDATEIPVKVFDGRIGHVAITSGPVSTYRTRLQQQDFDISSKDGRMANKYDFKVTDIKGYQCIYEPHGAVTFNSVAVKNITSCALEADTFTPDYGIWESESNIQSKLPQSFTEFNVVAETKLSRAVVPMLPKDFLKKFQYTLVVSKANLATLLVPDVDGKIYVKIGDLAIVTNDSTPSKRGTYVLNEEMVWKKYTEDKSGYTPIVIESVVPSSIVINNELLPYGSASYVARFPIDDLYEINNTFTYTHMQAYDNYLKTKAAFNLNLQNNLILFGEYYWKNGYSIVYPVKLWSISDTADNDHTNGKWIQASAGIYYLYYFDEYNDVHLALREYDQGNKILRTFSGNLYGQIEMRSMDKSHVTPMVFDYKLEYI